MIKENKTKESSRKPRIIAGTVCAALLVGLPIAIGRGCYNYLGKERESLMYVCRDDRGLVREANANIINILSCDEDINRIPAYDKKEAALRNYPLAKCKYNYRKRVRVGAGIGVGLLALFGLAEMFGAFFGLNGGRREDDGCDPSDYISRDRGSVYGQTRI